MNSVIMNSVSNRRPQVPSRLANACEKLEEVLEDCSASWHVQHGASPILWSTTLLAILLLCKIMLLVLPPVAMLLHASAVASILCAVVETAGELDFLQRIQCLAAAFDS